MLKTVKEKGYGIVEFNNMSSQRIGRTKAQLPLDSVNDFKDETFPCENGMLLIYDEAGGFIKKPTAVTDNVMLHKSEEKLYDERKPGLENFALFGDNTTSATIHYTPASGPTVTETVDFLDVQNPTPRLYQIDIGDTWTTNTVVYDDGDFADFDAIKAAFEAKTLIYGEPAVGLTGLDEKYNGYIKLTTTKPTGPKPLQVVKVYTLPNGKPGIKFEAIV